MVKETVISVGEKTVCEATAEGLQLPEAKNTNIGSQPRKFLARCTTCGGYPRIVRGKRFETKRRNLTDKWEAKLRADYTVYVESQMEKGYTTFDTLMMYWPKKHVEKVGFKVRCDCGHCPDNKSHKKKSWARASWNQRNGGWKNEVHWALVDKLRDSNYGGEVSGDLIKAIVNLKG